MLTFNLELLYCIGADSADSSDSTFSVTGYIAITLHRRSE